MTDLIARIVARLLCALLFPIGQRHRSARTAPPRLRRALPEHMSPYAREVAEIENRPIIDTTNPVRPYVLTPNTVREAVTSEERLQAYRCWVLDMATRGIDVGPARIHGVDVSGNASVSRTLRVAVGA